MTAAGGACRFCWQATQLPEQPSIGYTTPYDASTLSALLRTGRNEVTC